MDEGKNRRELLPSLTNGKKKLTVFLMIYWNIDLIIPPMEYYRTVLQDLTEWVMDAPLLLLILAVFERLCAFSVHVRNLDQDRSTINTSSFSQIFCPSQNRKRLCPLQQSNH
ncbi:hypothetical protein RMATCC62417_16129 [Rhizopus microsporus]|nr:hypothetical protein RMATCC62417_16129 [Rhizopus microsporus]